MADNLFAMLVHNQADPFEELKSALRELSFETSSVATCEEAASLIAERPPRVMFTDKSLEDGSWVSILDLAESADDPPKVIVVAAHHDTQLYVSVLERGAFDFVAPPFERETLSFVTCSAALGTKHREDLVAPAALPMIYLGSVSRS
ncbi:MAG: response regulator [Terriglobia bacterium]